MTRDIPAATSASLVGMPGEVDDLLGRWRDALGEDFPGYRNHVCRVIEYCLCMRSCSPEEREKLVIAACFHDLGIWSADTFDYLDPSVRLSREFLQTNGRSRWSDEIADIIDNHHRVRRVQNGRSPLVEIFRAADLIDLSLGIFRFNLPRLQIVRIRDQFPNLGFHRTLLRIGLHWTVRHPLSPIPVLRW